MAEGPYGGFSLPFAITVVALWAVLNITFNFFNSYALRPPEKGGFGFQFPFFYSGCHMIASFVGVNIIFKLRPDLNTLSREQWRMFWPKLLSLSVLMVLNIGCNNASLVYVGLSVNQIIKSITPLPTMTLCYFIEKKQYSKLLIADVIVQVLGAVLSVPYGDPMAETVGLVLCFVSMLAAASKPVIAGILMQDMKSSGLSPLVLVWYDSLFSIFWLFAVALCLPERYKAAEFIIEKPQLSLVVIAALCYNIVVFYLTKVTSALTNVILANIKQVIVVGFAAVFIDHISRWYNVIGICIFFLASFAYSYLTLKKPVPVPTPVPATKVDPAADERTDLLKK